MSNNVDAYDTDNQYGNQDSDRIIKKQKKNICKLLRKRYKLRTENQTLKTEVDRLKRDNDRLRRNNDMLTVENCQLKQFAFPLMQQNQNQRTFCSERNQSLNLSSIRDLPFVFPFAFPFIQQNQIAFPFVFPLMQQNQNQQTLYSGRNQLLNLNSVRYLSHVGSSCVFNYNISNQSTTEPTALSLESPTFIPKNKKQTHNNYNQQQNSDYHIDVSRPKLNYKNKSDDTVLNPSNNFGSDKSVKNINKLQKTTDGVKSYFQDSIVPNLKKITDDCGFCFGKKIKSWLSIEHLRTELEKAKDIIPENPRSLSEKLKNIKASSSQKINKVPNMTSEQEKF